MNNRQLRFWILFAVCSATVCAAFDPRQEVIDLMEKAGMERLLWAPVRVTSAERGPITILDEGVFIIQHEILPVENAPEPNVVIEAGVCIGPSVDKLIIVTHGWLDKGQDRWPGRMADAFCARTDPNQWLCAAFDWKGGSAVVSSIQAAEYARDIAGPRLAAAVIKMNLNWRHIHLLGHSAGAWVVQSAAAQLAKAYPDTVFHLTFLDAYVPSRWDAAVLGCIFEDAGRQRSNCWAEHYYTRDITLEVTEHKLKWAHNVDISALDPFLCEHEFPYRWYMATITGRYERWDERNEPVYSLCADTDYGFARSLECSPSNWMVSTQLRPNKAAVVFERPKP